MAAGTGRGRDSCRRRCRVVLPGVRRYRQPPAGQHQDRTHQSTRTPCLRTESRIRCGSPTGSSPEESGCGGHAARPAGAVSAAAAADLDRPLVPGNAQPGHDVEKDAAAAEQCGDDEGDPHQRGSIR